MPKSEILPGCDETPTVDKVDVDMEEACGALLHNNVTVTIVMFEQFSAVHCKAPDQFREHIPRKEIINGRLADLKFIVVQNCEPIISRRTILLQLAQGQG